MSLARLDIYETFLRFLNTVAKHKRLTHEHIIHLVRLLRAISGGASEIVGRHRISQRLNLQCDSFTITFPLLRDSPKFYIRLSCQSEVA